MAAGVTLIITVFTIVAMTSNEWEHVKIFSSIVSGGCLGFWHLMCILPGFHGRHRVIGVRRAVGAISIAMNMPLILIIVGGIYVIESLSV